MRPYTRTHLKTQSSHTEVGWSFTHGNKGELWLGPMWPEAHTVQLAPPQWHAALTPGVRVEGLMSEVLPQAETEAALPREKLGVGPASERVGQRSLEQSE